MRIGPVRAPAASLITVLVAATVTAAGCENFEQPVAAKACSWMSGKASGGRTAFLVDVSNSTRGTDSSADAPDYPAALVPSVEEAVERLDVVSVGAFGGQVADLSWTVRNRSTDYRADNDNPDNQQDRKREAVGCLKEELTAAQASTPATDGTDVLGAMRRAIDWLDAGPGEKRLVVATDGLVTTGCANLTKSTFTSQREIDSITQLCLRRAEIDTAALAGVKVTLVGIGRPSSDQPMPTPQQAAWLQDLWRSLCGQGCSLSEIPVTGAGGARAKTRDVRDPVVGFQRGRQIYAVPSVVLFDTDKADLKPQAAPLLEDIAVSIRTTDYARVDVNGYADPRGDAAHNKTLSLQRARAVAVALGPGLGARPRGLGATRECPQAMASPAPRASDDLPCARRVEIVVTMRGNR